MKIDHKTDFAGDIRPLDAAEIEDASGAIGPLLVAMAIGAAAGVVAGVLTAPDKGSGITWQQIIATAQGRPPA